MATQPTLCDGCELDYFYIIGKYHGGVFPGHETICTLNRDELLIQKLGFSGVL